MIENGTTWNNKQINSELSELQNGVKTWKRNKGQEMKERRH
jgi:hypothetical protein